MRSRPLHGWDLTPREAVALQRELAASVIVEPLPDGLKLVAGCDLSFELGSNIGYAGIVVVELPTLAVIDRAAVVGEVAFPYVPGLLSFRESPLLLQVWERLHVVPDVVMLDGHGYAHPRRFGIACHFGLFIDAPTIGCAKSVLVGTYADLDLEARSTAPLVHRGETVGAAVRTKRATAPVFVSIGHRVDLPSAVELTLACVARATPRRGEADPSVLPARYRIPEPTRQAHLLVNAVRRGETAADAVE
jgi:deoxyribonuclease V